MIQHPAFYDSHLHLLGLGYIQTMVDLTVYSSIKEMVQLVSDQDIIFGRGWHQNQFAEQRYPTKQELNQISTAKPVIFIRVCGHVLVCNDKAMEVAGITKDTPQIAGGEFVYDTGRFSEDAMELIKSIVPLPDKQAIQHMFLSGQQQCLEHGITQVASDDFSTIAVPYELIIEALQELYDNGSMILRVTEQVNLPSVTLLRDFLDKGYQSLSFGHFKMGPLKLLADGSLGGRTAYLNQPYSDDPTNQGIKVFTDETLEDLIFLADSHGMDVAIHGIGDGIIDTILDTIERVTKQTKRRNHRHSIIHAQLATKQQINRMKAMGIMAIVQPVFLNSDLPIVAARLGQSRLRESYLFHHMFEQGIRVGFSTDSPVEQLNPFHNIYCAMTRASIKFPMLDPLDNDGLFTYEEALACYTTQNRYHSYDEVHPPKDSIRLDRDPRSSTRKELLQVTVLETYIDNELVYRKQQS